MPRKSSARRPLGGSAAHHPETRIEPPAKPLVPGAPAGAGGRAWPVELPDPARHDGDSERQPYPPDARRQFARRLRPAVHQGVGEHCRRRWLVGVPAPGLLIALDGTEHFCSRKIGCPQCSTRRRSDGGVEYFHSFLAASVVAPGHTQVLPLPAEFITPQDGSVSFRGKTTIFCRSETIQKPNILWLCPES